MLYFFSEEGLKQEAKRHLAKDLNESYFEWNQDPLNYEIQSIFPKIAKSYPHQRINPWFAGLDQVVLFRTHSASEQDELLRMIHEELINHKKALQNEWVATFTPVIESWKHRLLHILPHLIPSNSRMIMRFSNYAIEFTRDYLDDPKYGVTHGYAIRNMSEQQISEIASLNYHLQFLRYAYEEEMMISPKLIKRIQDVLIDEWQQELKRNGLSFWSTYEPIFTR